LLNVVASAAADLAVVASGVLPWVVASEVLPWVAGSEVLLSGVASEVLPWVAGSEVLLSGVASEVPLLAQAFVAPPSVQAFVAQPSVQGSALARLGHASAPPRSRQAFGAKALALGIRS
jgi:hypothetical protein